MTSPIIKTPTKRSKIKNKPSDIQNALQGFNEIVSKVNKQDAFELFGQYVGAELRELPVRPAIILQQKIQNLIFDAKLSCLPPSLPRSSFSRYTSSVNHSTSTPQTPLNFIDMTLPSTSTTVPNNSASQMSNTSDDTDDTTYNIAI